jgi:transposase
MDDYIGLDVSLKGTAVSIRQDGKRVPRGKCPSDPRLIADPIRKRAPSVKRVIFEAGPSSVWFYHALCAEGLLAICIDARHAKAALDMAANKADANDADGLAHMAEVGFYPEVRVNGFDSMLTRTLVAGRTRLIRICTELFNQIRCLMKTFGLIVPAGKGSTFREECLQSPGRPGGPRGDCAAHAGGVAQPADPGRGTRPSTLGRRSPKPSLSHSHVDPRGRGDHRDIVCDRH